MRRLILFSFLILIPIYGWSAAACVQQTPFSTPVNMRNPVTATFTSLPTVGNYVIVTLGAVRNDAMDAFSSLSDNQTGNTYSQDKYQNTVDLSSGYSMTAAIYSTKVVGSTGTFTLSMTITTGSSVYLGDLVACEVSGLTATSPLDQTGVTSDPTNMATLVSASGANSQTGDIVFTTAMNPTANPSSGYTSLGVDNSLFGFAAAYKIEPTATTSTATYGNVQSGVIATYKAAGTPSGGGNSQLMLVGVGK